MNEEFELVAKTFHGLEEVLAKELTELGASNIEIGNRMVAFTGDKAMMYKANFCLRTAIRILKPIKHFTANNADEVYENVKSIEWENYLDTTKSFSVDSVVFSNEFRHSKFVAYKVKDAIVDYFREKTEERPNVRLSNPDVLLNIHIAENRCTLSLDSSGESLHRRGYRQEAVEAPLNEVLAAGMILMTGWKGECDLIDPMCGSGTIPIEAALIARNIAPGVFRKEFAFEKWVDFDQDLFDSIYNDDSQEREFEHTIYGYDNNPKANEIATHNVKAAGVTKDIVLKIQPFQQFEQPEEKSIIITNPPYGERISTNDLLGLYEMIGERLKHAFAGNEAWILSYRDECFEKIGLRYSEKRELYNGSLECQFRKYQLFEGEYKTFRAENSDKSFRTQREDVRPRRTFGGDRERSFGDRKPFGEKRSFGDRKPYGERKNDGERSFGDRKPYGERKNDGERSFGDRKPYGERRNDGERSFGDRKPYGERRNNGERSFGDRKPYGERRNNGERSFGDRKPYGDRRNNGDRRGFGDRKPYGNRRPYGDRENFGEKKEFVNNNRQNDYNHKKEED